MRLALERRDALGARHDAALAGLFERGEKPTPLPAPLERDDSAVGGALASAWDARQLTGRRGEVTTFHAAGGAERVVLVGLGPIERYTAEVARRAAAEGVRALKGRAARSIGYRLPTFVAEGVPAEAAMRALADGAALGAYEFVAYRPSVDAGVESATIHLGPELAREETTLRAAFEEESAIVDAVVYAREIANLPADTATPERLAEEARQLGKEFGFRVTVLDETALARDGMGGLLAVGGGSAHPPRLVVLDYPGRGRGARTIALVGKGITFDSGGISLKAAEHLEEMKFDKSGAVAVLGIVRAAARLKVAPRVVGLLACAENLPGGRAYRPGDLVRPYGGPAIEVTNTDAEGRVVMADALGYAVRNVHADAIVDLATLTGGQVVALGDDTAALVATDDALAEGLLAASRATGEPLWRMPLTDYHRALVKSEIGAVRNSSGIRVAVLSQAAAFLETFVGRTPWAHLDIAGPAYTTLTTRKYMPAYQNYGATAFGVRLVTRFLLDAGRPTRAGR